MFVLATINAPSWRRTLLIGVAVVAIAGLTGSRMSSVVLMILLLCSPSLAVSLQWRLGWASWPSCCCCSGPDRGLQEALLLRLGRHADRRADLSPKLNTAGRREAWPELIEACSDAPITGHGVGPRIRSALTSPAAGFGQPHNDYIRTYCDTGLLGTIGFWGFFLAAGVHRPGWPSGARTAGSTLRPACCAGVRAVRPDRQPDGLHRALHDPTRDRPRPVGRDRSAAPRSGSRARAPSSRTLAASPTGYGTSLTERRI